MSKSDLPMVIPMMCNSDDVSDRKTDFSHASGEELICSRLKKLLIKMMNLAVDT